MGSMRLVWASSTVAVTPLAGRQSEVDAMKALEKVTPHSERNDARHVVVAGIISRQVTPQVPPDVMSAVRSVTPSRLSPAA